MTTVARIDDYRQSAPAAAPSLPLPANIDVEQALLGALLINNDVFHAACSQLGPEHFSEELHRRIFATIAACVQDGRIANPITLKSYFGPDEIEPGVTMSHYIARLCAEAVTIVGAPDYARQLVELEGRRRLIAIADESRVAAFDPPPATSIDKLVEATEERLAEVKSSTPGRVQTWGTAGDMSARLIEKVKRIRAGEEKPSGVTTGLPELDQDTGGLAPEHLWIVAGRASMGKTIFATKIVRSVGKAGFGALLLSLEVGEEQINARLLADMSYIARRPLSFASIMAGRVDDEDIWRLEDAQKRFDAMPIVVDCPESCTLPQIRSKVRAQRLRMAKAGVKLAVVVIDYLDFISASDRYKGNRVYEVAEISRGLKGIAKEQNVCIVLLAQINRQVEQRPDKRPMMSDLRDSGNLEQDADVVTMIYRESYYLEKSPEVSRGDDAALIRMEEVKHDLELIIGKNRAGPTRKHALWCDVACSVVSAKPRGGF